MTKFQLIINCTKYDKDGASRQFEEGELEYVMTNLSQILKVDYVSDDKSLHIVEWDDYMIHIKIQKNKII